MSTAAKIDWSDYNSAERPRIVLRVSPEERDAIRAASKVRGQRMNELVLAYMRPLIASFTPEGQRAYEIISNTVQAGIAWNYDIHGGGPGVHAKRTGDMDWHGIPLGHWVHTDPTTGETTEFHIHAVRQREGVTRLQAIMEYADQIMQVWTDQPNEEARQQVLHDIADRSRFRFAIAYVNLRKWRRFASGYELARFRAIAGQTQPSTPETPEEQAFYEWATQEIDRIWTARKDHGETTPEGDTIITIPGRDRMELELLRYPDMTVSENKAYWAGQWLTEYRSNAIKTGPLLKDEVFRGWYGTANYRIRTLELME